MKTAATNSRVSRLGFPAGCQRWRFAQEWKLGRVVVFVAIAAFGFFCLQGHDMKTGIGAMTMETPTVPTVRKAAIAGLFYPEDPIRLKRLVNSWIMPGNPIASPGLRALVLPHAGLQYSGPVAAKGYVLVDPAKFRHIAILAPAHRSGFRGISTGSYTAFATPLGEIPVDTATCAKLAAADPLFSTDSRPHVEEHAIEIHLPFIQTVFAKHEVSIIPLLCGHLEDNELQHVAEILRKHLPADTLLIASSDFTHYGPNFNYTPFVDNVPEQLRILDLKGADQVCNRRIGGFRKYLERTGATICGAVPIVILLEWLGADATVGGRLVEYSNSGVLTHDYHNCVSYAAIAFETTAVKMPATAPATASEELGAIEKRYLLQLARRTIGNVLLHRTTEINAGEVPEKLRAPGTCFVTLHYHGNLRGCIGTIGGKPGPLYKNIIDNTVASAFRDPRFTPLRQEEFIEVEVEISVLTPPRPVAGWQEIEIGKHGIILSKHRQQAVFLPQVAPEQGWDLATTLTHLSAKAGLPPDAWKEGAQFQVFEATVFNEKDLRK